MTNQRMPQQGRGFLRTQMILDGCARLISKNGLANLTTHQIARESQTSIGSLYHFFPNKEAILHALAARHIEALEHIINNIYSIPASSWKNFGAEEVVNLLAMPFLNYIFHYPDCQLMLGPKFEKTESDSHALNLLVEEVFYRVLSIRMPDAKRDTLQRYTVTLIGLSLGILQKARENAQLEESIVLIEIPRALVAYLSSIKQGNEFYPSNIK